MLPCNRRFGSKIALIVAAIFGVAAAEVAAPASAEAPPIFIGGQYIRQHAVDDGGHVLVGIRGVFEALGATVTYVPPRIVVVRKDNIVVAGLEIGRRTAIVGNRARFLQVAPIRRGSRVLVPLRGIAELAGATVTYSRAPRLVDIRLPNNMLVPAVRSMVTADVPTDPVVPVWAYALVGVFVLGFLIEIVRRLAGGRRPSTGRALQLAYPALARNQHGVGKIIEEPRIDHAVNRA